MIKCVACPCKTIILRNLDNILNLCLRFNFIFEMSEIQNSLFKLRKYVAERTKNRKQLHKKHFTFSQLSSSLLNWLSTSEAVSLDYCPVWPSWVHAYASTPFLIFSFFTLGIDMAANIQRHFLVKFQESKIYLQFAYFVYSFSFLFYISHLCAVLQFDWSTSKGSMLLFTSK